MISFMEIRLIFSEYTYIITSYNTKKHTSETSILGTWK